MADMSPYFDLLLTLRPRTKVVPSSKWLQPMKVYLIEAVAEGLQLNARFQVAPSKYEMTWYKPGSKFNRYKMSPLAMMESKKEECDISIKVLPGFVCGEEDVGPAHVGLHMLKRVPRI